MVRRTDDAGSGTGGVTAGSTAGAAGGPPNPAAELDSLLSSAPSFPTRIAGYDRLQVDSYVSWAEAELAAGRREIEHLLARYDACSAELARSRQQLAQAPKGSSVSLVSGRVRDMLRLASDEASALLDQARRERDESAAVLERARAEAADLTRDAASERDRLAGEVTDARARLAAVQAEVDDLCRQRDEAGAVLRRLTDVIGGALSLATGGPPEQYLLVDNHVADSRVESVSS